MSLEDKIFKIAVLNDLIGLELAGIDINTVINPEVQSKLRNLKKSTEVFTKWSDETFKHGDIQEAFGDFCDELNEVINDYLKVLRQTNEN